MHAICLRSTGASCHEDAGGRSSRVPFVGDSSSTSCQPPQLTLPNVSDLQTLFLCCEHPRHYPRPAARLLRMGNDGLIEAFARLSTSDSRLHALEALLKDLTPYEWRFVQSLANTQTFQCDLIGQLPVELVSQIFSYLDTTAPWRLQLVSQGSCCCSSLDTLWRCLCGYNTARGTFLHVTEGPLDPSFCVWRHVIPLAMLRAWSVSNGPLCWELLVSRLPNQPPDILERLHSIAALILDTTADIE